MTTKLQNVADKINGECLYYLAPGARVWWPVMVKNDMVEFPFNKEKYPLSDCPGKFSCDPSAATILRSIPSEKRAQVSRENGKKGGRPRKDSKP